MNGFCLCLYQSSGKGECLSGFGSSKGLTFGNELPLSMSPMTLSPPSPLYLFWTRMAGTETTPYVANLVPVAQQRHNEDLIIFLLDGSLFASMYPDFQSFGCFPVSRAAPNPWRRVKCILSESQAIPLWYSPRASEKGGRDVSNSWMWAGQSFGIVLPATFRQIRIRTKFLT